MPERNRLTVVGFVAEHVEELGRTSPVLAISLDERFSGRDGKRHLPSLSLVHRSDQPSAPACHTSQSWLVYVLVNARVFARADWSRPGMRWYGLESGWIEIGS